MYVALGPALRQVPTLAVPVDSSSLQSLPENFASESPHFVSDTPIASLNLLAQRLGYGLPSYRRRWKATNLPEDPRPRGVNSPPPLAESTDHVPDQLGAMCRNAKLFLSRSRCRVSLSWLSMGARVKLECAETAALSATTLSATSGSASRREASTAMVWGRACVSQA